MGVALLDSTSIVAFLDSTDALHRAADRKVRDLRGSHSLISSVVSYAELITGVGRGHHDEAVVRGFFAEVIHKLVDVDLGVAERAGELRGARRSLRLPDALILGTADRHEETELVLTADAAWARVPGLRCRVEAIA